MKWIEEIEKVLKYYGCPMNYEVIAKEVIKKGYKLATKDPKFTVNSQLTKKGNRNRVMSLGNGKYMLVDKSRNPYVNSKCKHVSGFIKFSDGISPSEKELLVEMNQLLDLIVNFRLPLVIGEMCFADILDKLEVEISEEAEPRDQLIDVSLLRNKLDELRVQIAEIRNNPMLSNS